MAKKSNSNVCSFTGVYFHNKEYALIVSNVRETYGHDDSWPFNADWEIKKLSDMTTVISGHAWDGGWGGIVQYDEKDRNYELANEFSAMIKEEFSVVPDGYTFTMKYDLPELVSVLAMLNVNRNTGVYQTKAVLDYLKR